MRHLCGSFNKAIISRIIILFTLSCVLIFVSSCSNRGEEHIPEDPPEITEYEENEKDEDEEEEPIGPLGMLTGLPIYEGYVNRRPLAVVVNNDFAALPQSGLIDADIIYEVLIEGAATRLLAVFHTQMPERVGPIRSTRYYFADMALNHDSIFIHHGGTIPGYHRVRDYGVTNLDGMALETTVFWRDRTYPAWTGIGGQRAMEHSSYSAWDRILTRLESQNMRQNLNEGDNSVFGFNFGYIPSHIQPMGNAELITVPFSIPYSRTFTLQPDGSYLVSNPRGAHVDAETQVQVSVQNILVQITQKRIMAGSDYRYVDTIGSGRGYLFTNGQQFEVAWEKTSPTSPMQWHFADGTPLVLTPGKTWICVLQTTATIAID